MVHVIGLLGGIGSGKSALARALAERGLVVLDADAEARAVLAEPDIGAALAERFGREVLDGHGGVDRAALAAIAFEDRQRTGSLNAIVHPRVRQRLLAGLQRARDEGRDVVLDVPLLLESPLAAGVTAWVYLDASEADRERRVASRGWAPGERVRREAQQADLATKRARADYVLENSGSLDDLVGQVDALLRQIGVP